MIQQEFNEPLLTSPISFMVSHVKGSGLMTGEHWHDYYEVLFVSKGSALQKINRDECVIEKGDMIVIKPWDVHKTIGLSKEGCTIFVLLFSPYILKEYKTNNNNSQYLENYLNSELISSGYFKSPYNDESNIYRIIYQIQDESLNEQRGHDLIIRGLFSQLIGYLQRNNMIISTNDKCLLKVQNVCKYIEENITSSITVQSIARAIGYTKEHLSREFKKELGINIKRFIDYVKINEAEKFILHTDCTMSEVAMYCGYNNYNSFFRSFKRIKGYNPSDVLKKR